LIALDEPHRGRDIVCVMTRIVCGGLALAFAGAAWFSPPGDVSVVAFGWRAPGRDLCVPRPAGTVLRHPTLRRIMSHVAADGRVPMRRRVPTAFEFVAHPRHVADIARTAWLQPAEPAPPVHIDRSDLGGIFKRP
jgi:hypothetical protein